MKNQNDIHKIFTDWGTSQRQLPPHNEELKHKMLAGFHSVSPITTEATLGQRTPWFSIAFAGLAGLVFILNSGVIQKGTPGVDVPMATQTSAGVAIAPAAMPASRGYAEESDSSIANQAYKGMMPEYYPYPQPTVPANDIREFLRTDYSAQIRTRNTTDLTRRVETTVRGFGGRVDNSRSSSKWGSVTFVVPASKFEAFRDEIESFVGSRLIETEISTENLLSEKLSIEERLKMIEQLPLELREVTKKWVETQDQSLLDKVATVHGTISLSWISVWEIVELYVSTGWIVASLIALALISYLFERRRRFC